MGHNYNQDLDTTTYQYDAQNRLIRAIHDDSSYYTITYSAGKAEADYYSETNQPDYKFSYNLDASGRAVSATFVSFSRKIDIRLSEDHTGLRNSLKSGDLSSDTLYITYEYDANGYCIRSTWTFNNITDVFTYVISGGNSVEYIYSTSSSSDTTRYEFYTDKINTIGRENNGIRFLGKQDKNLVKTEIASYSTRDYTYEFDAKNRVSKMNDIYSDSFTLFTYME